MNIETAMQLFTKFSIIECHEINKNTFVRNYICVTFI
jgi:hypothetical protein